MSKRKRFDVIWSDTANSDLESIISFIAQDSLVNATKVLTRIQQKVSLLQYMPQRGRIVPELLKWGLTLYHELIIPPWRIIYRISDNSVYVLSVIDSRRNVEDLLLARLIR